MHAAGTKAAIERTLDQEWLPKYTSTLQLGSAGAHATGPVVVNKGLVTEIGAVVPGMAIMPEKDWRNAEDRSKGLYNAQMLCGIECNLRTVSVAVLLEQETQR